MNKLKYWLPTIAWMAVIFFLSSRTPKDLHSLFPFIVDFNPGHTIAYFILGLLSYYSLIRTLPKEVPYGWMLLITLVYGISDEFHQRFVPGRTPDINDLVNDLIGTLIAVLLIRFYQKRRQKRAEQEAKVPEANE